MKRYLLFAGWGHDGDGGYHDFHGESDDLDELKQVGATDEWDWAHILDTQEGTVWGRKDITVDVELPDGAWEYGFNTSDGTVSSWSKVTIRTVGYAWEVWNEED